ncbi:MAG: proline--tRNA ligase, partial [Anaerolineae bacterium]|nr:proline--tRNA ligase [Anaerolineae bacterium]
YGIGVGRLLACIAEAHHDDDGLIWPVSVAPFPVHLVLLPGGEALAERLYSELQRSGFDVLFDDRDERAGVKFKDADLIGLPIRLTVGERSIQSGGVEFKRRDLPNRAIVRPEQIVDKVQAELAALQSMLNSSVEDVPYRA